MLLTERVVRMEEQIAQLARQEETRIKQEEVRLRQERERDKKIDNIILELGKYKGFIGGVLFICSCLWAFLKLGIPYIAKLLGKQ